MLIVITEQHMKAYRHVQQVLNTVWEMLVKDLPRREYFRFEPLTLDMTEVQWERKQFEENRLKVIHQFHSNMTTARQYFLNNINAEEALDILRSHDENLGRFIGVDFSDWLDDLDRMTELDMPYWINKDKWGHWVDRWDVLTAFTQAISFAVQKIKFLTDNFPTV